MRGAVTVTPAGITFRLASPADALSLSRFAELTFRETFTISNTAADMELYCASAFGLEIQRRELMDPLATTIVGEAWGQLVAYAQLFAASVDPSVPAQAPVELRRFYLARTLHGSAVARLLMAEVVEVATAAKHDVLWLGVWERNPRAIRFYEKCGFRAVGDHIFLMGSDPQRDLIMSLPLPPASSRPEVQS
jgi:GNAT superfamily N-acetyltransferase